MRSSWIPLGVLAVVLLAAVVHMAYYYPRLPDPMASHFDWQGNADGIAAKGPFFAQTIAFEFGIAALLFVVGMLMRWLPASIVNMPNKDHWLSPPQSRRTRDWIVGHMFWMAGATALFFIGMNHAVFRANLAGQPGLGCSFHIELGAYLAFTLAWCLVLFWRFRRPTQTDAI